MNHLQELRNEREYTIEKVANDLNISIALLTEYEKEITNINSDTLYKFTKYYQVNSDYIMGFDNDYLYAQIEQMNMTINFTYKEYQLLKKDIIYFIDNKRYIDFNDISALMHFQEFVEKRAEEITSIDWKYLTEN